MSTTETKAVFLSYASQDAEAAKRIADALRAAGVEVWFDQSELVGGDAWDQKIRRQIKECALLVPIISANTQARTEGYFRLEWRLADQRTHLMAKGRPFLLPVVIDDTRDADAQVPDSFTEVQWTRLPGGEDGAVFAARVKKLLGGEPAEVRGQKTEVSTRDGAVVPPKKTNRLWLAPVLLVVFAGAALLIWQPWRQSEKLPASAALPAATTASATEIARARARIIPDRWQKGDFDAIAPALDRIIAASPDEADAWALRSIINSLQVLRILDPGTQPLETGKTAAEHALRLAPESPLGQLALGLHLVANVSRGGDPRACREPIDRAVAALAPDALTRYAELVSFWLGYDFENTKRVAAAWLKADPPANYPAWIMTSMSVVMRQATEVEKWAERSFRDQDVTSVRALCNLADAHFYLRADLAACRATLERIPVRARSIPRVVYWRWLLPMAEGRWDDALQELAQVPDAMLLDVVYNGPKALLVGLAHQQAGRADAANSQFREAERLLREKLAADPDNEALRAVLAVTLASAGQADEARRELTLVEPLVRGRAPNVYRPRLVVSLAQAYGALGDFKTMAFWLRKLFAEPSSVPFTPASFRLDPRFNRAIDAPEIQALLKEFASLDMPVAAPAAKADDKSVAVLAFANLSDDKANEYFSDGISEELLNVLAKISGLKVSARTSAFYFKGKQVPMAEIARQLGVAYVVEGSVRKQGDKVRITAQLIKAADGFHVWSDTFTRDLKDIFAVQDEIAGLIAQQLQLKFSESSRAVKQVNPEAYRLVLEGRHFWMQRTEEGFVRAEAAYKKALEYDPQFAQAHAGLADVWSIRAWYKLIGGNRQAEDDLARASTEVRLAIQIDPSLAETYATLGAVLFNQRKFSEADQAFQASLRLNPNYGFAHHWYAQMLFAEGRPKEGLLEFDRAISADPLAFISLTSYAVFLSNFGLYEEALAMNDRAIALRPDMFVPAVGQRADILLNLGRKKEALALARSVVQHASVQPRWWMDGTVIQVLRATGQQQEAEAHAAQLLQTLPPDNMLRGYVLAGVGRPAEAVQQLFATGLDSSMIFSFIYDSFWDEVRKDPRLPELLAKLNLVEEYRRGREALAQIRQERERKK
ncbi:MAG: TIR domain-containing protein [Opitutae bacterium]|nr:TIR domain-containing protein [Opitutae bacterium]